MMKWWIPSSGSARPTTSTCVPLPRSRCAASPRPRTPRTSSRRRSWSPGAASTRRRPTCGHGSSGSRGTCHRCRRRGSSGRRYVRLRARRRRAGHRSFRTQPLDQQRAGHRPGGGGPRSEGRLARRAGVADGKAKGSGPPVFAEARELDPAGHGTRSTAYVLVRSDIISRNSGVCCSVTLYAGGERRTYSADRGILYVHRFAVAGDMRTASAPICPQRRDLYRTLPRRRGAPRRHQDARWPQGLPAWFLWLGSSYELIFDADRRVPISSEARTPAAGGRTWVTRVRYSVYGAFQPGARLELRLRLPVASGSAYAGLLLPCDRRSPSGTRRGGSAARAGHHGAPRGGHAADGGARRSTYALVRPLEEGFAAAVLIPDRAIPATHCLAIVEIAHRSGETSIGPARCDSSFLSTLEPRSRDGPCRGHDTRARASTFASGWERRPGLRCARGSTWPCCRHVVPCGVLDREHQSREASSRPSEGARISTSPPIPTSL